MWKRMAVIWTALRGDLRILWRAIRHPQCPRFVKLGALGLVLYLFLPIDIIPDFIPFVGALDDVLIVGLGIKWLVSRLPAHLRTQAGA